MGGCGRRKPREAATSPQGRPNRRSGRRQRALGAGTVRRWPRLQNPAEPPGVPVGSRCSTAGSLPGHLRPFWGGGRHGKSQLKPRARQESRYCGRRRQERKMPHGQKKSILGRWEVGGGRRASGSSPKGGIAVPSGRACGAESPQGTPPAVGKRRGSRRRRRNPTLWGQNCGNLRVEEEGRNRGGRGVLPWLRQLSATSAP